MPLASGLRACASACCMMHDTTSTPYKRKITHPVGLISELIFSKTRRAHTTKMVASERSRRRLFHTRIARCLHHPRCREKYLGNSSQRAWTDPIRTRGIHASVTRCGCILPSTRTKYTRYILYIPGTYVRIYTNITRMSLTSFRCIWLRESFPLL